MRRTFHIARASLIRRKGLAAALFIIIALMSALTCLGLSVMLGVEADYMAGLDRLNSAHGLFVMSNEDYLPSYLETLKADPRVSEAETAEALFATGTMIDYGGEMNSNVVIINADSRISISAPVLEDFDGSVPAENAVYLPSFAKELGFKTGAPLTLNYRNRPLGLIVAGFFKSNEMATSNSLSIKLAAAPECFGRLAMSIGRYTWLAIRCYEPEDVTAAANDFMAGTDINFSATGENGSLALTWKEFSEGALTPIMVISAVIMIFAFLIALVSIMMTRFRVGNSIEETIHDIGALKASGYTGRQAAACYAAEYGLIALPAAVSGLFMPMPLFAVIRGVMTSMTGIDWTLDINIPAGLAAAFAVVLLLMLMVWRAAGRARKLQPVEALRGGIAANSFRRNHLPLNKGGGGVSVRLGLKNIFAYGRTYAMVGLLIAATSFVLTVLGAMYGGLVLDSAAFVKMMGMEMTEIQLNVTRHTDADALARELKQRPEVRKTSMLDWISFKVDGVSVIGFASDDFTIMDIMDTHEGRFPVYDNEIAMPKLLADQLGKRIGDTVTVRANGIELDSVITGFYSVASNGGRLSALTLDGYRRFDPHYKRSTINVYLNGGYTVEGFTEYIKENYGVLNEYKRAEGSKYAAAKARAEEKITNYMEYFGIDSVEYAVMKDGEIILSGSSAAYQIERIIDLTKLLKTQIGTYESAVSIITQMLLVISLVIICLILGMTARQIISKRRRELGILKASGFTAGQLAAQIAVSFLPSAVLGVVIGCGAGVLLTNPVVTIMFSSTGVHNAQMYANPAITALFGALILLFSFGAAHISAMRIKKISVYELMNEGGH